MNSLETLQLKKEMILMEIERDQEELKSAIQDLGTSMSLSEKVRSNHKSWIGGAFVAGLLIGVIK